MNFSLREKCPNTELFLIRIFPHSKSLMGNLIFCAVKVTLLYPNIILLPKNLSFGTGAFVGGGVI